ncbi:hypothetical protein GQ600_6652 [Phytophthora cactorum]|nr:hypothetical protein GQ600_6652 [Phytophthora cactorum]
MADRAAVEEWRQTFTLYIGEVQGEPTPSFLGLYPGHNVIQFASAFVPYLDVNPRRAIRSSASAS